MKSPKAMSAYPNGKTCQAPCANVPGYGISAATGNLKASLVEETLIVSARTTIRRSVQAIGYIWTKGLGQHGKQICPEHV